MGSTLILLCRWDYLESSPPASPVDGLVKISCGDAAEVKWKESRTETPYTRRTHSGLRSEDRTTFSLEGTRSRRYNDDESKEH